MIHLPITGAVMGANMECNDAKFFSFKTDTFEEMRANVKKLDKEFQEN